MFKRFGFLFYPLMFTAIFAFGDSFIYAQDDDEDAPVIRTAGTGYSIASASDSSDDDDETKVTGATVRGRVFYEDTNRPARFIAISLVSEKSEYYNSYSSKYVKTDANGEFVMKNVKPGTYLPSIKSDGILTPEVVNKSAKDENDQPFFDKITVSGLGEMQIMVRAKRGGAVSGRIQYADGESAVGVKVEVLKKQGEKYGNVGMSYGEMSAGSNETDDRGVYRLTGLPAGTYIVRVNEPFSHSESKGQYGYNLQSQNQSSLLKTYFPEGESTKTARELEITLGQEQTDINITLPERQLFDLTGKIVSKKDKQPLENFTVSFSKLTETDAGISNNFITQANLINANKSGDWTLKSLPKGKYRLTVSQTYGYRPNEQTEKSPEYPRISQEIEITDKNIENIIFEVPSASSLSGTIVTEDGKPAPSNSMVLAFDEKTKEFFNSQYNYAQNNDKTKQSEKVKSFQIAKMTSGKFKLSMPTTDYYVKSITLNGRDVTNSAIEIGEGEDLSGVKIVISTNMGTIKGRISNFEANGRMFAVALNPSVNVADLRGNSFSGMIGANGEFQIKAKPGEYAVILFSEKFRPKDEAEMEDYLKNAVANAPKVTVKANEISTVTVEMLK